MVLIEEKSKLNSYRTQEFSSEHHEPSAKVPQKTMDTGRPWAAIPNVDQIRTVTP